jgi:hypothetical protein
MAPALRGKILRLLVMAVIWVNLGSDLRAWAGVGSAKEHQIKTAIVYNSAKFVEWPPHVFPHPSAPIILGVLQGDNLTEALESLSGKFVQGHRLVIKKIGRIDDLKRCQVFFASAEHQKRLAPILSGLANLPVLTITDGADNFARLGGIINLTKEEGKIRFQINLTSARRAGLKISSQLLKLASIVGREDK